jgi:hypothetical protein
VLSQANVVFSAPVCHHLFLTNKPRTFTVSVNKGEIPFSFFQ